MDPISSAAAYSVAQSNEQVKTQAGIQVLKKAQDQEQVVADLLARTFQSMATGLGRKLDVQA